MGKANTHIRNYKNIVLYIRIYKYMYLEKYISVRVCVHYKIDVMLADLAFPNIPYIHIYIFGSRIFSKYVAFFTYRTCIYFVCAEKHSSISQETR